MDGWPAIKRTTVEWVAAKNWQLDDHCSGCLAGFCRDILLQVYLYVDFVCSQNMLFVEASAKTAAGVADIFEGVAAKLAGGLAVSAGAQRLV